MIIVDNAIDNAMTELEEEDEEDIEEEFPRASSISAMSELELPGSLLSPSPVPSPPEPHVCAQCHLDPPDGSERSSSFNEVYLHERCEPAFIQTRMAAEGVPWTVTAAISIHRLLHLRCKSNGNG